MKEQVIAEIEAWWQERRATSAMDVETHNSEQARVDDLKQRIEALDASGVQSIDPEAEILKQQEKRTKK